MSATISLLDFTLTWDTARLSSGTHSISVTNPFLPPMHPNRDPALFEGMRLGDVGANLAHLQAAVDDAAAALEAAERAAAADPVAENPPADTEGVRRENLAAAERSLLHL